jgi:hypothetical protein
MVPGAESGSPEGEPAAGVIEELRNNNRGVRQPCMSSDAHS